VTRTEYTSIWLVEGSLSSGGETGRNGDWMPECGVKGNYEKKSKEAVTLQTANMKNIILPERS
jgi:hypothetical protein